jgi:putative methanogenesis marker 16 metalloprotein
MAEGPVTAGTTPVRTIADINERLRRGEAVVLTAQEFKTEVRRGHRFAVGEVDVVTTATRGVMSGTAAMFGVPVAGRGVFARAARAWLNGVEGFPGPAPNERLGRVDLMVYGTAPSRDAPARYGGGHLFRDLLEGQEVEVEVRTDEGATLRRRATLRDFDFARMYNPRNAYRNYMAFGNFRGGPALPTIFGFRPMAAGSGVTVVGSGELNPLQNDPDLRTIQVGTRVLVNGAPGLVVGAGTGSTGARPNLSVVADMLPMDPRYAGGVVTSAGVEVLNSVAIPIPVLTEATLRDLAAALDERIPLPVADVSDRVPLADVTYGDVWTGRDLAIRFDPGRRCVACTGACPAEAACPVEAISWRDRRLDEDRCIRCGACAVVCPGGAFQLDLGTLRVAGQEHPITFRLSDRLKAMELTERLAALMRRGEFLLASGTTPIRPGGPGH